MRVEKRIFDVNVKYLGHNNFSNSGIMCEMFYDKMNKTLEPN